MSSKIKRTLTDRTNERKRFRNDSSIDLNFDIGQIRNQTSLLLASGSVSCESMLNFNSTFDLSNNDEYDDDVFDCSNNKIPLSKLNYNPIRKRLNGTSTYRVNDKKQKRKSICVKDEDQINLQTLNQLREEQTRIDSHPLSIINS